MPSIAKRRMLRKRYKSFFELFPIDKLTQTTRTFSGETIEVVKKTRVELERRKIVDCVFDSYSKNESH